MPQYLTKEQVDEWMRRFLPSSQEAASAQFDPDFSPMAGMNPYMLDPNYAENVMLANTVDGKRDAQGGVTFKDPEPDDFGAMLGKIAVPLGIGAFGLGALGSAGLLGGAGATGAGTLSNELAGLSFAEAGAGGLPATVDALATGAGVAGLGGAMNFAGLENTVNNSIGAGGNGSVGAVNNMATPDWLTQLLGETGELGVSPGALESGFNAAASNAPWWSGLPTWMQNAVQATGLGSLGSGLGSIGQALGGVNSILGGLNSAVGALPGQTGNFSLLGGLLGAALGSQNKPQQSGTQTIVQDIPEWQKGYLTDLFSKTQNAFNQQIGNQPDFSSVLGELNKTVSGGYMPEDQSNPFVGQTTPQATNQYIGQKTANIGAPQARNSYIGQMTGNASNPYIGRTNSFAGMRTPVGTNPLLGLDNPYLDDVAKQTRENVSNDILTRFGAGNNANAFGTTAMQQTMAKDLSDAENRLRYQDYGLQAQLGEADVSRRLQAGLADLARNAGISESDLMRNSGLAQQLALANQATRQGDIARNAGLNQDLSKFNTGLGMQANLANQGTQLADLSRNSQLAQNQSQFNSGLFANDLSRNAGLWNTDAARNLQANQFERGNMLNAALQMPGFSQNSTSAAFAPYQQAGQIFGNRAYGGSTSSPIYSSPWGGALGGFLAGGSLGNSMFGGMNRLFG